MSLNTVPKGPIDILRNGSTILKALVSVPLTEIVSLLGNVAFGCDTKYSVVVGTADGASVEGETVGTMLGSAEGSKVGTIDGNDVTGMGAAVGTKVGSTEGATVGKKLNVGSTVGEGEMLGIGSEGVNVGAVGRMEGRAEGDRLGTALGLIVGTFVGFLVGPRVGLRVGFVLGLTEGTLEGESEGTTEGDLLGTIVGLVGY